MTRRSMIASLLCAPLLALAGRGREPPKSPPIATDSAPEPDDVIPAQAVTYSDNPVIVHYEMGFQTADGWKIRRFRDPEYTV